MSCPPHRSRARSESPLKQKLTTLLTFCDLDVKNDVEAKKEKTERCSGSCERTAVRSIGVFLVLFLPLDVLPVIYFLHYLSFSQTPVPAAPVSMETAASATAARRGSRPTPASAPKATRGRGAIRSCWTCRPQTGTPPPHPLLSWPPRLPPRPQLPLSRRNQPPSPPPHRRLLPPCSHGNPNLGRGCW